MKDKSTGFFNSAAKALNQCGIVSSSSAFPLASPFRCRPPWEARRTTWQFSTPVPITAHHDKRPQQSSAKTVHDLRCVLSILSCLYNGLDLPFQPAAQVLTPLGGCVLTAPSAIISLLPKEPSFIPLFCPFSPSRVSSRIKSIFILILNRA